MKQFKLIDGVLHYQRKEGSRQVITEMKAKREILEACHDHVGGCHFGRDKTFVKVSACFYWKGIKEDVCDWVSLIEAVISILHQLTSIFIYM